MSFHVPNEYRIRAHPIYGTTELDGNNGAFRIHRTNGRDLYIIASDATGWEEQNLMGPRWEHVSVHAYDGNRTLTPRWDEMCYVKNIFWDEEDTVIQFHPPKSEYVNNHNNVLHLWRCIDIVIPLPPSITVGIKL